MGTDEEFGHVTQQTSVRFVCLVCFVVQVFGPVLCQLSL